MTFAVMLSVVACYTLCAFNDKYAVSKARLTGAELSFIMSAGTIFFLLILMPFMKAEVHITPMALLPVALITLCKYVEFSVLPKILFCMTPFELKGWVGLTLFMSYFTDVVFYGTAPSLFGIMFILVTLAGLALVARADRSEINYREIWMFLVLYLLAKFGYGLTMRTTKDILPNNITLILALTVLMFISFARIKTKDMISRPEGMKGVLIVAAAKLPNALGMLGENYTASRSLANYSFIQPLILISLFIAALTDKKRSLPLMSKIGGVVIACGVVGFQLMK